MSLMRTEGFVFRGNNSKIVLERVWKKVNKYGKVYMGQRGPIQSLKGVTIILENPQDTSDRYPYWDKKSDEWYQNYFVRKETNNPPEDIVTNNDIYPYKYVWRSRYYDDGWGYVKGTVAALKKAGITKLALNSSEELTALLTKTYAFYHPESLLAVLAWKGQRLLNYYLANETILDNELARSRKDTLMSVISELKENPNSRRAITPSFTYENIDHSGVAGAVPVYQNYQLYVDFDSSGEPKSLISMHLHRALDGYGGTQLDINHDYDWGKIAAREIGLPLSKIIIYCNDMYIHLEGAEAHTDLVEKTSIQHWLRAVVDSYDPKQEDIEKRLSNDRYKAKIRHAWQNK